MTVSCPIKHIAEADNPSTGELVIAPNLTATGKARTVSRNCSTPATNTGVAKCTTDVAAEVAAGPSRHRSYIHRLLGYGPPRQVCGQDAGRRKSHRDDRQ